MSKFKKVLIGSFAAVMLFATASHAAYSHSTTLKQGSRGAQVMSLQQTLNMTSCKVASVGAGSPGMETSYFGPATKAAVKCFQTSQGISSDGVVGPMSGAKLAMVTGTITTPGLPAGCTTTAGFSPVTGQSCAGGSTTPQSGPVAASLSATTPAAGYIIDGQATAGLLDVTFSGNGTVNSVTLTRSGISDQNTLTNVYLYDGANRLTDGYSFNSQSQITINNLNLSVNGSRTISVKADVASGAASSAATLGVALTSFTAGATVNNVNIQGNLMNTASGSSLATASLSANTVTSTNVNAGVSAYPFWSAPIQVNTRAVWLKSASFRMVGSAPSDAIANLKLFVDGVDSGVTGTVMAMNGSNYVNFNLMSMPKSLSTGSHTLDVRGNVEKGSSRTVQFSLQQAADLMITDPQVGVNLAVSGTVPNNGGTITINSGSLTINNDPTFQAMTNVTGGASNVTIAKYKLRAYGEDVKVNSIVVDTEFTVAPTASPACTNGTNCSLDDVTLYFNGSQIGTQQDWNGVTATDLTYNLGSQLIVPAGTDSYLEVRANVRTSGGANYTAGTVRANLVVGSSNAQGQNSFTTLSTPAITGTSLSIQTGLLAVSKNSGYANQSVTPNTAGVKIGSFVFQNQSSSESVRVTNLSVALGFTGSQSLVNFSGLRTSEASGSGATPVQPQATNNFSVDFTLAPGATKTLDVFADTGSTTTGTIVATLTTTSIGVSSNVSTTSSAVTGQTITVASGTVTNPPTFTASASASAQYIASAGGAMDAVMARYNFQSTAGASTITELKFTTTGTAGAITSVKVNGVSAPVIGTLAWLTGLNIPVAQGGSGANVDVMISYANVGISGIASASTGGVDLTYVKYTSGGTTAEFSPTVSSNTMTLVGSKPTVALGLPNGVAGSSVTGLSVGTKYVADIRVTADAKGDVKVVTIPLTFTGNAAGTTTTPGTLTVKNAAGSTIATATVGSVTGSGTSAATATITFTGGYTISAGQTETFKIEVPVTAVSGTGASLATGLGAAASFTWTDVAGNGTAGAGAGTLILNYPTSSVSMTN